MRLYTRKPLLHSLIALGLAVLSVASAQILGGLSSLDARVDSAPSQIEAVGEETPPRTEMGTTDIQEATPEEQAPEADGIEEAEQPEDAESGADGTERDETFTEEETDESTPEAQAPTRVYLGQMDTFQETGSFEIERAMKDNLGDIHDYVLTYRSNYGATATYLINQQYALLTGVFFQPYEAKNYTDDKILKIYGDGRELYTETMRGGLMPIDVSVDVTGVTQLKIDLDAYDGSYGMGVFGDAALYTDKDSEPTQNSSAADSTQKAAENTTLLPVNLGEMDTFQETGAFEIERAMKDNLGDSHSYVMTYRSNYGGSATYVLNGQYSSLTGVFFQPYEAKNYTDDKILKIYGDGRELYTETMRGGLTPIDVTVDITGITLLKIDLDAYDGSYGMGVFGDVLVYP